MGLFSLFSHNHPQDENTAVFHPKVLLDMLDKSSLSTIVFNQETNILFMNKRFLSMFEYRDIDDFKAHHQSIREILLKGSDDIFVQDDKSWLEFIKTNNRHGHSLLVHSKTQKHFHVNAKSYTIDDTYYILELEDITKLKSAQQKIQKFERSRSLFFANMEHEFRTPMNGIVGFVELLHNSQLNEEQLHYLDMIEKSSHQLMSNIDTMLDYYQMQSKKLRVNNSSFSLLKEMESFASNVYKQGVDKGVDILTFIDPNLPKEILGDAKKIKQILEALVFNAFANTCKSDRIILEVKLLEATKDAKVKIDFSVKDNGKGVANKKITSLKDALSPLNHAESRLEVALSLAYGFVNLLGGELHFQHEEGFGSYFSFELEFNGAKGEVFKKFDAKKVKVLLLDHTLINEANLLSSYLSSFHVEVIKVSVFDDNIYDDIDALYIVGIDENPLLQEQILKTLKKAPTLLLVDIWSPVPKILQKLVDTTLYKPLLPSVIFKNIEDSFELDLSSFSAHNSVHNISALVVEDNVINQRLIEILLQKYNILVDTAMDGIEALSKCSEKRYDIIFMDIDMPYKNGLETTKELKMTQGANQTTPIVALTAMSMDGDKEMLMREGLDDYIAKPITLEKLERVLEEYLKINA